jgi:hypothetical protein
MFRAIKYRYASPFASPKADYIWKPSIRICFVREMPINLETVLTFVTSSSAIFPYGRRTSCANLARSSRQPKVQLQRVQKTFHRCRLEKADP